MYTGAMSRQRSAPFMFVLAILLFAGVFVVLNIPEAQGVQSDDGALTVTGLARSGETIAVSTDATATIGDPLLGMIYRVEPSDHVLAAPIVLSFAKRKDLGTADATTVYQWNTNLGMWIPLASVVADTNDVLAVEVMSLGDFAVGADPMVEVPSLLSAQDTLKTKSPAGTRGYRFSTSYTLPGGVPVDWPDAQVIGGCGGRVGSGDRTEYSSTAQTVTVPVNDVQTAVTFTVVAEWIVAADGSGCSASAPLKDQE